MKCLLYDWNSYFRQDLDELLQNENITITDDAASLIANVADGGMRDAINLLDQLVAYCNSDICIEDVYSINGSVSYNDLYDLLNYIISNDKESIINFVDYLGKSGKEINKLFCDKN